MERDSDPQIVLGVGELLWDCFPDRRLPGGAPANVVFHVTRLGHRGVLASRVGNDADGEELRAFLSGKGIDLACLQRDEGRPTGRVTVDVSDSASPHYVIHEDVAWDAIELDEHLGEIAGKCGAICVGTLAQRSPRSRRTIQRCLELAADAVRVYDVNLRPPWFQRAWIEETLRRVTIVKLNIEEVSVLDTMLEIGAGSPAAFSHELIDRFELELVCVTRGPEGCLLVTSAETHEEPGEPVHVIDAVGAGDAFTAGLISGRLRGLDLYRTSRLANRLGARVAGSAGAMPESTGASIADLGESG